MKRCPIHKNKPLLTGFACSFCAEIAGANGGRAGIGESKRRNPAHYRAIAERKKSRAEKMRGIRDEVKALRVAEIEQVRAKYRRELAHRFSLFVK